MRFLLGYGSCGIASGADSVLSGLNEAFLGTDFSVEKVGCNGLCFAEPIVEVITDKGESILYGRLNRESAVKLAESAKSGVLTDDNRLSEEELAFLKGQKRIVLSGCGKVNPESIDSYIENGGYNALKKALSIGADKIIEEIKISGLRGRGGAGFPTHIKWQSARNSQSDEKYIVCNADEGDPGAFMDRAVLEGDPHRVLEGMMIAGIAVGAETGIIYVRAEYPLAVKRLKIAINEMREKGILGENIFGSGFNFDFHIMMGAGAFVCGEETALMTSIEGHRGEPKSRPPFPAVKGLWEKPTILNNVETYANIPHIILRGVEWFNSIGTEKSKGTKVFALGGKIKNTGLVEVPMGTTLREIIEEIGGGIPNGKKFKAAQTGGPSGGCIPATHLDTPIDYDSLMAIGSMMGSGGLIVMDEDNCMVDIAKFFLELTVDESCGKCTPCRIGTKRLREMLEKITDGKATLKDLDELEELCYYIKENSLCGLGQTAPNPVLATLKFFREEYIAHVVDKKCPAGVCKDLLSYEIEADKCFGCGMCAKQCPADAIQVTDYTAPGKKKPAYAIDKDKCVKCGACVASCKFKAIIKK